MATHEQKPTTKRVMYVYKLDTGNRKHEAKPPPEVIKKGIARGWGVLRRSKTYRENELNRGEMIEEARKSVTIVEESRKSVSFLEEPRKSVPIFEESRKSVPKYEDGTSLEARKFAAARVEMNVASVAALLQVKIMVTDMPGFMQVHALRCARQTYDSLEKFSAKHIAHNLKKEFDMMYGPAWHCIVGSSYGSFVTHATGCFLYFSIEKLYILVFKTKVQKSMN